MSKAFELSTRDAVSLAAIGSRMVEQNNRATSCPVWLVGTGKFPRVFLTDSAAKVYCDENGMARLSDISVASAWDSSEMKVLMRVCLEAAGYNPENNDQVRNAYSLCWS